MQIPVFFLIFVVFIVWLQYKSRRVEKHTKQEKYNFWDQESQSNSVRAANITNLPYIVIPLDRLPMKVSADPSLKDSLQTITCLSDKKIINLTGYTNTDLKFKYGAGNIDSLTDYDENFLILIRALQRLSEGLEGLSLQHDAIIVLEYALSIKTEISNSYRLLAKLYMETNQAHKIHRIAEAIPQTNISQKKSLIRDINLIKEDLYFI